MSPARGAHFSSHIFQAELRREIAHPCSIGGALPTPGMIEVANHSGSYTYPVNSKQYPRVQIITVPDLLRKVKPNIPTPLIPYFQARRRYSDTHEQMTLA